LKILIVVSIFIVGLIIWRVWNKVTWKTVMVGADTQSEEALRQKYDYYRVNKIRCKIRTELQSNPGFSGGDPMVGGGFQPNSGLTKLLVHRKDIKKVNELN
jgi:hypothetical protein